EVDSVLHPLRSELNWPMDAKIPLPYTEEGARWRIVLHIFDGLQAASKPQASGQISIPTRFRDSIEAKASLSHMAEVIAEGVRTFALQSTPHTILLIDAFYDASLRPAIARWLVLLLRSHGLFRVTPEAAVQKSLAEGDAESGIAAMTRGASEQHRYLLRLAVEWLHVLLPHTLRKVNRVSYGLLDQQALVAAPKGTPVSRLLLAVPFVGKDVPSLTNEFAHPDVVIGFTVLAYRLSGLRPRDFESLIAALRESMSGETGPHAMRKSSLMYAQWLTIEGKRVRGVRLELGGEGYRRDLSIGDSDFPPLTKLTKEQYPMVLGALKLSPEAISWYLDNVVFPETMQYRPLKVSASGQELGGSMLFGKRLGFSGTPSSLMPLEFGECQYER
ncbi:MAG TPA: DUF3645 domain-containing protein, partial [archaeon]|nr:DUF3645 domain-containing protein [archaeon]